MSIEMTVDRYVSLLREGGITDLDEVLCAYATGGPMVIDRRKPERPLIVFFSETQGQVFLNNYDEIKQRLGESSEQDLPDQVGTGRD